MVLTDEEDSLDARLADDRRDYWGGATLSGSAEEAEWRGERGKGESRQEVGKELEATGGG